MTDTTQSSSSEPLRPRRGRTTPPRRAPLRGRRWVRAGVAFAVFIAALVALAPTLLSTAPGNRLLLAALNRRIAGRLEAEHVSIGWFSGFSARGVTLKGSEGELVFAASRVDTELRLPRALQQPLPLGKSAIDIDVVNIVAHRDGTTSLSRAIGPATAKPSEARASELPFTGDVQLAVGQATFSGPGKGHVRAKNTSGQVLVDSGQLAVDLESSIEAPDIATSRFRAHVRSELDTARRVLVVTEPSSIGEGPEATAAGGNRLELTAGTKLSWGDEPSDAMLLLKYDLHRLSALLAPLVPDALSVAGRHETKIHISGRLASGAGLTRLRGVTIAPTSFAYERIEAYGLALTNGRIPIELADGKLSFGNAELPANGGAIVLAGHIDLAAATPRYVVEAPHVAMRNFSLNAQLAAGPMRFLPVSWGVSPEGGVSGVMSARLESASLPLTKAGLASEGRAVGRIDVAHLDADAPAIRAIARELGPLGGSVEVRDQNVSVPFELADGRVHFDGVTLNAGALHLTFSGHVGLDGTLDATSKVTAGPLPAPATVTIAGTVDKPEVKLTSSLSPSGAEEQIERAPGRIEKLFDKIKGPKP